MKLKKFEQQPKHVENIPIEAINLDSEQEQPPKPDKAVGKNVFQPNSKYFTLLYMSAFCARCNSYIQVHW